MKEPKHSQEPSAGYTLAAHIDQVCDQFETDWMAGHHPRIEDFLQKVRESERRTLLRELLRVELDLRRRAGESTSQDEYQSRFAGFENVIQAVFAEGSDTSTPEPGKGPDCSLMPWPSGTEQHPSQARVAVRLNCPHCDSPIEAIDDREAEEIICPSCGSSVRLAHDRTNSWKSEKLPRLGKFELLEAVGRGAFGTVYRARDTELDRIVAIKLPRSGSLATLEDEDRFVREARSVAQLRHPNIVPLYETGKSEHFPYIVSEFVDGVTLADLITGRRFTPRESAQLTAAVAEALQYAHDQGVVHRDVKPSNIMLDDKDKPHLMDFGLARRDAGEITMTVEGQVLGTPAYMSPEQARGEGHRVDGRSDVYSLGVILYELLAGELPFRGNARMLLHQVLHDEPRSVRSLNDRIPRDAETVCLKAMAKEPDRRYATAGEFAADLRRWLAGEPIVARPVGQLERGWRWAQRNSVVAGLSAALVLILLAGIGVSSRFAIEANARAKDALAEKTRANAEREKAVAARALEADQRRRAQQAEAQATLDAQRANLEAQKAQEVARFLATMFEESAPFEMVGIRFGSTEKAEAVANMTARAILDRGAQRVTNELANQPIVQAALKDAIGNVYLGLGMLDKAAVMIEEAHDLRGKHVPRVSLDMAASLQSIGVLRFAQMRFRQSASAFEGALAIRRKLLGDDNKLVDATRASLATLLVVFRPNDWVLDVQQAEQLWRETLAWRRKHLGNTHRDTAVAMFGLAGTLQNPTDPSSPQKGMAVRGTEAALLLLQSTPILLNDPATRSLGLAMTQLQQAEIMFRMGRPEAAVAATRKSLELLREVVDENHPVLYIGKAAAVINLARASQIDEAEEIYRECMAIIHQRRLAPPLRFVRIVQTVGGKLLANDRPRGEALYRDTYEMTRDALQRDLSSEQPGPLDASALGYAAIAWGSILQDRQKTDAAESLYREALLLVPEDHENEFETMRLTLYLGDTVRVQRRFAEAEQLYRRSLKLAESCRFLTVTFDQPDWKYRNLYGLAISLHGQQKRDESVATCKAIIALGDKQWTDSAEKLPTELNGEQ